ncbi:hypothetical protein HK098_001146 [Nowakowskiella sp. JEL0407]|nr:hypothetical protein HK098_001146 [Nowakowskiella sp. JEL0407]
MYKKEAIQQQAVIDKLVADAKDIHDIRKQKEVLEETTQMIPDCENRLQAAHRELALQIEEIQGDEKLLESEEAKAAIALIQELGL